MLLTTLTLTPNPNPDPDPNPTNQPPNHPTNQPATQHCWKHYLHGGGKKDMEISMYMGLWKSTIFSISVFQFNHIPTIENTTVKLQHLPNKALY